MNQLMKHPEEYKIWRKVLELAQTIQKGTEDHSSSGAGDVRSTVRKITFTIPSHLAEGFMMRDLKDRKDSFYRALNGLEEILNSLVLIESMGFVKKTNIHNMKQDLCELNKMIGELISPTAESFVIAKVSHPVRKRPSGHSLPTERLVPAK
jgi:four helix bundle protein